LRYFSELLLLTLLFSLTTASSCEKKKGAEIRGSEGETFYFNRLLVLPFERRDADACPLCRQSVLSCRIESEAESALNKLLMSELRDIQGLELVSQSELKRVLLDMPEPARTRLQVSPDFAVRAGKKVGADAVLHNIVFCYRERVGNAAAVSQPAAISFHLHLFRTDTGEMVWRGKYEEEQVPLSENLFTIRDFIRRGAKWVKVEMLAQDGMRRAMEDFPAPDDESQ
jgi:hypothetical protein